MQALALVKEISFQVVARLLVYAAVVVLFLTGSAVLATGAQGQALSAAAGSARSGSDLNDWTDLGERLIQGLHNNLEPVEEALGTNAYAWARAVILVTLEDSSGSGQEAPICSGARVGESLFLTNAHCDLGCGFMRFTLGAERDTDAGDRFIFRCTRLLRKNASLDYALYYAEPEDGQGVPHLSDFPPVALSRVPLADGMPLVLPGHPNLREKMLDRSFECVVDSAEVVHTTSGRETFTHLCDTEGGSSGSPVLDRLTGNMVGLHWGGQEKLANFAIPAALILEDLERHLADDVLDGLAKAK